MAFIGLGNPGSRYAGTRHNAGFMVIDRAADRWRISVDELRWEALTGSGRHGGESIRLIKPQTWMNESGRSVRMLVADTPRSLDDIIVIVDDASLPLGTLRLRKRGSDGGHNGLANVLEALNSSEVPRLRVGIGPAPGGGKLRDWVLAPFDGNEVAIVEREVDRAVDIMEIIIRRGMEAAMQQCNTKPREEEHED